MRHSFHAGRAALLVAVLACSIAPVSAVAQTTPMGQPPERRGWHLVRVAKWALVGVAAGFGVYALTQSREAEATYGELKDRCFADSSRCSMRRGRYLDPVSEGLYDRALRFDHRARVGIIGGQTAVLGSAVLFIYDLRHTRGPGDIPYPARSGAGPARGVLVGARFAF